MRRKSKVINCVYFRQSGNVFGGCKHPSATSGCLGEYLDNCDRAKSRFRRRGGNSGKLGLEVRV